MSAIDDLTGEFARLPGIGRKTALRLTYHLLKRPPEDIARLARALERVAEAVHPCSDCGNLTEHDPCDVCANPRRDHSLICVVEESSDVMAIERAGEYRGLYHVLGGRISPLEGVGPDELNIRPLLQRLAAEPAAADVHRDVAAPGRHRPASTAPSPSDSHRPASPVPSSSDPHRPASPVPSSSDPHRPASPVPSSSDPHRPASPVPSSSDPHRPASPVPSSSGPHRHAAAPNSAAVRTGVVQEVIVATNPSVEGEATALYLQKVIRPLGVRVTRLARGLPVGGDLEYADGVTIAQALAGRRDL